MIGKSRSHIANTLRLLKLPEAVQAYLRDGQLTAGHARALVTLADPAAAARRIVEDGLSVRDAEALGEGEGRRKGAGGKKRRHKDADTRALEKSLSDRLGLAVAIDHRKGKAARSPSVREFATISRGTKARNKTVIGSNTYVMSYVHIPHDSVIGNNIILSNAINMGGHVVVDDWAIIGGMVGIHQFVHIGAHSFIAFSARVTMDVPPYILAGGSPLGYKGLNVVGLKRRGFTDDQLRNIKNAYNLIYGPEYNISDAIKAVKDSVPMTDEVKNIISFIEQSERGIIRK